MVAVVLGVAVTTLAPQPAEAGNVLAAAVVEKSFNPSSHEFGSVREGKTSSTTIFLASGGTTFDPPTIEGSDASDFRIRNVNCYIDPFDDVITKCEIGVGFEPTKAGSRNALLVMFGPDIRFTAKLSGTATSAPTTSTSTSPSTPPISAARLSTGELDFGPLDVGSVSVPQDVTVTNTGTAPLQVSIPPIPGDFTADGSSCESSSLKPNGECKVRVRFVPTKAEGATGRLLVRATPGNLELPVNLRARGVAPAVGVTVAPNKVLFGEIQLGNRARPRTVTVTNIGRSSVDIAEIAQSGQPDFSSEHGNCAKGSRLQPQDACELQVSFDPKSEGSRSARLTISFTGGAPSHEIELSGHGATRPTTVTTTPDPGNGLTLTVAPGEARIGEQTTVTGRGYRGETRIYWGARAERRLLASLTADADGRIETPIALPPEARAGRHVILACDEQGCASDEIRLTAAEDPGIPPWIFAVVGVGVALLLRRGASALAGRGGDGGKAGDDGGQGGGLRPGEREVRTGFSPADDPMASIDETLPLVAGERYHFWVELGRPAHPPAGTGVRLNVALFGYEGEFAITSSVGELALAPDGAAEVINHGGIYPDGRRRMRRPERRLVFPVQSPSRPGTHRIRCSIYHRQVLVQSWVVSAVVDARRRPPRHQAPTVHRQRDFVLVRSLDPGQLDRLAPHQLSLLLNANGDGYHSFRLFGEGEFRSTAVIGSNELGQLTTELRRELEEVACERARGEAPRYRYQGPMDIDRLSRDLIRLARFGFRTYASLVNRLASSAPGEDRIPPRRRMAPLLRSPGRIQVANRKDATDVVPAAFFYDHPLDSARTALKLCPTFFEALNRAEPLETSACFRGRCPSYGETSVVCPSGFWGYRHIIGVPQSLGESDRAPLDVPLDVGTSARGAIPVGVSTDPRFRRLSGHLEALRTLHPDWTWEFLYSRESLFERLREPHPPLVYFYCHGGSDAASAYIQVGPLTEDLITGDVFAGLDIFWESHPLVFVNGCNTAVVGPETPLKLVAGLVEHANAAGVVGTQVTVFEPLACVFAETLLHVLLVDGEPVGQAVRTARLALLKQGNPLGLVYTPFVSDEVAVARSAAAVPTDHRQLA